MKKTLLAMPIVALLALAGSVRAGEKNASPKEAHLGIGVEMVPAALYNQLPGVLKNGQGVLVGQVVKDSPAAKAGLHANDILLSYGDQKLSSPDQLVKLVHGDKPGHEVALNFLRGGKAMSCKVTLGEAESAAAPQNSRVFRLRPDERFRKLFDGADSNIDESMWESFDEIKLSRVDGKRWRAEVEYRSKDGKKVAKHYSGTRDEIRKAIQAEKDLPANEQTQLLHALNLNEPVFEFHFPPLGFTPPDISDRP